MAVWRASVPPRGRVCARSRVLLAVGYALRASVPLFRSRVRLDRYGLSHALAGFLGPFSDLGRAASAFIGGLALDRIGRGVSRGPAAVANVNFFIYIFLSIYFYLFTFQNRTFVLFEIERLFGSERPVPAARPRPRASVFKYRPES